MTKTDRDYFRRRAEEERVAADRTGSASARRVHLELAERYDGMVAGTMKMLVRA